jgi:hypothetical protein
MGVRAFGFKRRFRFIDAVDQVEQLAGGAAYPIQLGDEDHVALAERCY